MTQSHQSFACLVAVDPETARITHASETCGTILGHDASDMLDANMRDLLGVELWHALRNAASNPAFGKSAIAVQALGERGESLNILAYPTGPLHVIEVLPKNPQEFGSTAPIDIAKASMAQLLPLKAGAEFASHLSTLLRHFTGSEHVLIWDRQAGDAAICTAESKRASRDSMLGAQSQWPALWPDDCGTIGLISDVQADPVSLLTASDPLVSEIDLTKALSSNPSPDLTARLQQLSMRSSILLRLARNGTPWAVVECQSSRARVPSSALLSLFDVMQPFLDAKLQLLHGA
ncbi:hypothetical protein [Gymnodinialimonas hymeniacidonis]|uniref:hypothetical protein n=1 Tax=Gymnodinialimonas hymeniacidonis TaxID=3126508 RepID=UPI0034C60C15